MHYCKRNFLLVFIKREKSQSNFVVIDCTPQMLSTACLELNLEYSFKTYSYVPYMWSSCSVVCELPH